MNDIDFEFDLRRRRRGSGFTLLELLVVLAIASMMLAVAAPRMWNWVDASRERAALDILRARLEAMPSETFFSGKTRQVAGAGEAGLTLPEGWQLRLSAPLVYEANGMTGGGRVGVFAGERRLADWQVLAPAGRVTEADAAPR